MPEAAPVIIPIITAVAGAAATVVIESELQPEPSVDLQLPSFTTGPGGGSAVPIIRDLIEQQTTFLHELLPAVVTPLADKVSSEVRLEAALLQIISALLPSAAEEFGALALDTRNILIPGISAAAGALAKILEALIKGEPLPAESVLQIFREVLVGIRTVAGKQGAQWLGPLTQIITVALPQILGKRDRVLKLVDPGDEGVNPLVSLAFGAAAPAADEPSNWLTREAVYWLVTAGAKLIRVIVEALAGALHQLGPLIEEPAQAFGALTVEGMELLHTPMESVMEAATRIFLGRIDERLGELGEMTPEAAADAAPKLVSTAAGLGMAAHLVAVIAETVEFTKHLGLPQVAALLVDMAGFKTLAESAVGQQFEIALRTPIRRHALSRFRPELPDPRTFDQQFLERLVPEEEFRQYWREHGWSDAAIDRHLQEVYREARPRDLALAFEDAEVDEAWLVRMLQRAGFNDEDADHILTGIRGRAQKTARAKLIDTELARVELGIDSVDFAGLVLQDLHLRPETLNLYTNAAARRRLTDGQKARRQVLEDMAGQGLMTSEDLRAELAAVGYDRQAQDEAAELARLKVRRGTFHDERQEVKREIRQAQADRIAAALELYRRFQVSESELADILRGHNVVEDAIGPIVELATVRRIPVPKPAEILSPERLVQVELEQRRDQILALQHNRAIDEGTSVALLQLVGLERRPAELAAGLVAARLTKPVELEGVAAARAEAREIQTARTGAALERFRAGQTGAPGFERELIAAGVSASAARARVDREQSRQRELATIRVDRQRSQDVTTQRKTLEQAAVAAFRSGQIDQDALFVWLVQLGDAPPLADARVQLELARRKPPQAEPTAPPGL